MKFVRLRCAEEEELGDRQESSSKILISSHEGGVTKTFENPIACHNERVDATKTPRPTKPSNLLFTLLSPLALW